ncbi:MAG: flippase-like domain-containing protein [Planctomycetes bacterium]|nr:flippase-like domain-containing protein [Planctomycetota bacterium]
MTPKVKKRLFDVFRIVVCIGALWIVVQGVTFHDHITLEDGTPDLVGEVSDLPQDDGPIRIRLADGTVRVIPLDEIAVDEDGAPMVVFGLKTAWRKSRKPLILLAVIIYFPVVFLQGLRFRWLLLAQQINLSFWECVKLSWAGNFLNFATPLGSNAGDVFKAYFASLHTERKTEAATTVVLDRVIGLGCLLAVVGIIATFASSGSRLGEFRPYVLGVLGAGLVGFLLYLSPWVRKHLVPWGWLMRLPMFEQLRRIDVATRALASHKTIVVGAVVVTVLLQALAMGGYFTVAVALGLIANAGNILEYYAYFYIGAVVQALPGPPQGLGTVELVYRYFLAPFGNPSQIVCVAVIARLVALVSALPGLLVTVTGSYKPREATPWPKGFDGIGGVASDSPQEVSTESPSGDGVR